MTNSRPFRLFSLAILAATAFVTYSCREEKDFEPEIFEKPRDLGVSVLESSGFQIFPLLADYQKAFESGAITLKSKIKVEEATKSVKASWFWLNEEGNNIAICSENLSCKTVAGEYESTMSLLENQFDKMFGNGAINQANFFCTYLIEAADQDVASTKFNTDTMTISRALPKELKILKINTVNGEEPTCEYVSPPPGNMGGGIKNCTKVPGKIKVYQAGKLLFDSGDYVEDESGMTLKIRGNTSAYGKQKPYKIKLQKKHDLMERGDEKKYEDKEWILLRAGGNLNTFLGLESARLMEFSWVPAIEYVNVVVNGDYRGLYALVENFKRNPNCRANIDENGFLVEKDAYWWNEDLYFDTSIYAGNMKYTFKYPSVEDIDAQGLTYIKTVVDKAEKAIRDGSYDKHLDVTSYAKWLLFHDIWATLDCGGSNVYFMKKNRSSSTLLEMLSPWDFDSIYFNGSMQQTWSNQHITGLLYFHDLLASPNKTFLEEYKRLWASYRVKLPNRLNTIVKDFINDYGEAVRISRSVSAQRWGGIVYHPSNDLSVMQSWFKERVPWLDTRIDELK